MDKKLIYEPNVLHPDLALMMGEYMDGKPVGEDARVPEIKERFSWKKSFVNCWTGNPNVGKSTFLMFMALMKAKIDGWKWGVWSKEMISSHKYKDKVYLSSSDIFDDLVYMLTGKNPYRHLAGKFGIISKEEYITAVEWLQKHFIVINPPDAKYSTLIENFKYLAEYYGTDGIILDPWKNVRLDINTPGFATKDDLLHEAFDIIKDFALMYDQTANIIAHPKSLLSHENKDGTAKVVTAFDLAGGAAWYNSMDGIYSIHRPYINTNPKDDKCNETWFWNLKQRKQHLVGKRGVYDMITYKERTNRYYFNGFCPLDGEALRENMTPLEIMFNAPKEEIPF